MIEQKQNDWVLNLLGNQNFSTADFKAVGLNATNTSLLDEDVYKKEAFEKIKDTPKKYPRKAGTPQKKPL